MIHCLICNKLFRDDLRGRAHPLTHAEKAAQGADALKLCDGSIALQSALIESLPQIPVEVDGRERWATLLRTGLRAGEKLQVTVNLNGEIESKKFTPEFLAAALESEGVIYF